MLIVYLEPICDFSGRECRSRHIINEGGQGVPGQALYMPSMIYAIYDICHLYMPSKHAIIQHDSMSLTSHTLKLQYWWCHLPVSLLAGKPVHVMSLTFHSSRPQCWWLSCFCVGVLQHMVQGQCMKKGCAVNLPPLDPPWGVDISAWLPTANMPALQ